MELDEKVQSVIAALGSESLHPDGKKVMTTKIRKLIELEGKLRKVDFDFKNELSKRKDRLELVEVDDMRARQIDEGSLVLYSENADSYLVYEPEKVGNFVHDFSTLFRRNGLMFEVIMDANPQKLVFIIRHNMKNEHISQLKSILLDYIQNGGTYNVLPSDIKIFRDGDGTSTSVEIIVKTVVFNRLEEKITFVEKFKDYLTEHEDITKEIVDVANKIDYRLPKAHGLNNAKLLKAPYLKLPVISNSGDDKPEKIFDKMATNIVINQTFIMNGDINNGGMINKNNGSVIIKNKTIVQKKRKEVKDYNSFCKYVFDNKPDWYRENQMVAVEIIYNEYQKYSGDYEVRDAVVSRNLGGKMFAKGEGGRDNGKRAKRLYTYEKMQEEMGF